MLKKRECGWRREEVEGEERRWIEKAGGGGRREEGGRGRGEVEGEEEVDVGVHQSTGCGELPNLGGRLARHIYISAPL